MGDVKRDGRRQVLEFLGEAQAIIKLNVRRAYSADFVRAMRNIGRRLGTDYFGRRIG